MSYEPRYTAPDTNNKYYIKTTYGGYSPCIIGNTASLPALTKGSVIPNCVGYATGRFNEIINDGNCRYLGNKNAEDFYKLAQSQGLSVGNTPKLGACAVWSKGVAGNAKDGAGHVMIVEDIVTENEFIASESGWSATKNYVWKATHKYGDGNWLAGTDSWMNSSYKFLGFIYNPAITDETRPTLQRGSKSIYVKELQTNLKQLNYNVSIDSIFGSTTESAVKLFQRGHGLSADGIVGDATQSAIRAALIDTTQPDGVETVNVKVDTQAKTTAWITSIDSDKYIRVDDLVNLGLIKLSTYNEKQNLLTLKTK